MNKNNFTSSPIRTYKKQNKPNPMRTLLVLLMTAIIIAAVVIFIMSLTGTGLFSDKKPAGETKQTTPEQTTPEVTTPEITTPEITTPEVPDDPNAIKYSVINKTAAQIGMGELLLINEDHLYKFGEPDTLESLYPAPSPHYYIGSSSLQLKYTVKEALDKMMAECYSKTAFNCFNVVTAYRDFDTQAGLHENNPSGAVCAGASDYHSGATLQFSGWDPVEKKSIDLKNSDGGKWLKQNAYLYGFVFRSAGKGSIVGYDITWQLRYVGLPHAEYMYVNNLCLEEYLERLSTDHRYVEGGKNNLTLECINGNIYQVYYAEGTTEEGAEAKIPVPSNRRFTISGDNVKGFIVTVLIYEGSQNN